MSGNKRGVRYLPFTCCTCVFLPLHGMQRRVETLLSKIHPLDSSFHLAFRPRVVFQSCRISLQPPIQYRILENDRPREIPTLGIYSSLNQDERLPIGLSDCSEIRFSITPNWNPGVSKSTTDTSCGHLFWAAGIDRRRGQFRFVCLSLTEGDIGDRLYMRILNFTWDRFIFIAQIISVRMYFSNIYI